MLKLQGCQGWKKQPLVRKLQSHDPAALAAALRTLLTSHEEPPVTPERQLPEFDHVFYSQCQLIVLKQVASCRLLSVSATSRKAELVTAILADNAAHKGMYGGEWLLLEINACTDAAKRKHLPATH